MKTFTEKNKELVVEGIAADTKKVLDNKFKDLKSAVIDEINSDLKLVIKEKGKDFIEDEDFKTLLKDISNEKKELSLFADNENLKTFYYKYQNDVDGICIENGFKVDLKDLVSLDNYIPFGVKFAIVEACKMIRKEIK